MGLEMTITGLLIMASVMMALALAWFGLHYLLNPRMENPDGIAKVTGSCGDTMEIALNIQRTEGGRCSSLGRRLRNKLDVRESGGNVCPSNALRPPDS